MVGVRSVFVGAPAFVIASFIAFFIAVGCGSAVESDFDGLGGSTDPTTDPPGSSSGFDGKGDSNVHLDPKNATVIIDIAATPPQAGSVIYKVTRGTDDVSAGAQFTVQDPSLGNFSGATFTSVAALPAGILGKSTTVTATTERGEALGTLTVVQLRKTGKRRDFFFVVPYQEAPSPTSQVLEFSTNIKQADVAFVMDTTGSMQPSINNLKSALSGTLFAQLQAAIPNVGLAVVDHKDFLGFLVPEPWAVNVRQVVTTNLSAAQGAVNAMSASGGGDPPEAQVGAMFHALTGQANNVVPSVGAHTAPAGTFGGVDFRTGSVPILVEITDAPWHDPSGEASIGGLKAAFAETRAKFVHIVNNEGLEGQANDLSDATGSNVPPSAFGAMGGCAAGQCCTGVNGSGRPPSGPGGSCRLNFLSAGDGSGVSAGIVQAIQAIAVGTVFDVKAVASNDPKNVKGVDATKFIKALRAMDEGHAASGCPVAPARDSDGDGIKETFVSLRAGTPACFEVIPAQNTIVPPELDAQFFNAFIDVVAVQGDLKLDTRSVLFLVPPKVPGVN